MSTEYSVAMIGCGGRGREHLPGLRADSRCRVVALADVKRDAAEALDRDGEFGAAIYTDHREMLEKHAPQVVVVSLWTPLHLPVFRDCVEAGARAVLSEKPMAPTWGECLAMAQLAEKSNCQLTFCHQRRFREGNRLARRLIEEGRFGTVQRMDLYSPPNLLDCGTHTFDQALSFNGETPARWVIGAVDTTKLLSWFDVKSEGMASGLVVFENGVRANIQVGGEDKDMDTGVRVVGSEGFIEVAWDGEFGRSVVYSDPSWKVPEVEQTDPMIGVVKNAIDCIESGEEPVLSHKKALRAAEIIFALYESVRRHQRVALPLETRDSAFLTMLDEGRFGPAK